MAGYVDDTLERTVKLTFVTRFFDYMSVKPKKLLDIHYMVMREVILQARILILYCRTTPLAVTATRRGQTKSSREGLNNEYV